jgi:hypothetical protein
MGANAQTSVPLFVANSVLTAAQQNISAATGVPVFATTVTRDAAFGGSNKVLAEGQLAYIEASNVVQYYDGAAWATVGPAASKIAQVISTTKTDTYTMSSQTYATITGLTATITPTLNTSTIYVVGSVGAVGDAGAGRGSLRLIRDSTAIAVGTSVGSRTAATAMLPVVSAATDDIFSQTLTFLDSPASTSALVYGIQVRSNDAATTMYVNRSKGDADSASNSRVVSTITVIEVLA